MILQYTNSLRFEIGWDSRVRESNLLNADSETLHILIVAYHL